MKRFITAGLFGLCAMPACADNLILTAYDNNFYSQADSKFAASGQLVGISDIYYYYDPINQTLKVTQTEWLADGAGGEEVAPYDSIFNYTNVTFDNMCQVVGYCNETFKNKIDEMRMEYEVYLGNTTNNKNISGASKLKNANAYTDDKVEVLENKLSSGIASAVAMSSIEASNVAKGEVSVGGGYGYYNSRSAVAFGCTMGLTDRWSVNTAAGLADSNISLRAGTNYKFKLF